MHELLEKLSSGYVIDKENGWLYRIEPTDLHTRTKPTLIYWCALTTAEMVVLNNLEPSVWDGIHTSGFWKLK